MVIGRQLVIVILVAMNNETDLTMRIAFCLSLLTLLSNAMKAKLAHE
jgi:hypothetical protein